MSATISRAQLQEIADRSGPESPIHELLRSTKKPRGSARAPAGVVPPSLGRTLSIVAPMPVSIANASGKSRQFWSVRRHRGLYFKALDFTAAGMLDRHGRVVFLPFVVPIPPIGRASVTSTMYLGNRMDQDNAVARHKWLLDWLQDRGYLHNDRLLEWSAFPAQVVKRGQEYRIELTITEPTP